MDEQKTIQLSLTKEKLMYLIYNFQRHEKNLNERLDYYTTVLDIVPSIKKINKANVGISMPFDFTRVPEYEAEVKRMNQELELTKLIFEEDLRKWAELFEEDIETEYNLK